MGRPEHSRHRAATDAVRALAGFLLAVVVACGEAPTPSAEVCEVGSWDGPRPGLDAVLVLSDTLRRDYLGAYGGPARTPAFDALAAESWLFTQAMSQAPWTTPSVATLFTGLYPSQHGVLSHPETRKRGERDGEAEARTRVDRLPESLTTLAELLAGAGYRTAALVGNPWLRSRFGFAQGFARYDDSFAAWDVPGTELSRAALAWLDAQEAASEQPHFLYVHYMDAHRPYPRLPEAGLRARAQALGARHRALASEHAALDQDALYDMSLLVELEDGRPAAAVLGASIALVEEGYRAGVEQFDAGLAVLVDGLRARGRLDDTLLVVLSDHGESLYHRGFGNHGSALYEDEVAIPLLIRLPGAAPARSDCPAGLVDVLPTLAAALGVAPPEPRFGRSLLEPVPADRPLVAEGVMHHPSHRALRKGEYKLLWQPEGGPDGKQRALFRIRSDTEERRDLLLPEHRDARATGDYDALLAELQQAVPAFTPVDRGQAELTPAERQRLEALGYGE